MGNASKALVLAGGMLISILIISICMYMYTAFKSAYSKNMKVHDALQIEAFNANFSMYSDEIIGWEAYNICGKICEVNSDPDALTTVTLDLTSVIDIDTYKTHEFYFTEALKNNVYSYSYEDKNADGLIDTIYITN